MAKAKESKGGSVKVPNKSIHSRVSYLYQAAAYLESRRQDTTESVGDEAEDPSCKYQLHRSESVFKPLDIPSPEQHALPSSSHGLSRKLLSDLRAVSLKTQIRLSPAMKHTICKRCNSMLIDGYTCTLEIENRSKGGKEAMGRCACPEMQRLWK